LAIFSVRNGLPATIEEGFINPPNEARLKAYWWWLNGNVTKAAITRDLEQMKAKGFGGALICDADGSSQDGNQRVKHGPTFLTPDWRALYRHALSEGQRLGLEMSLNIQSGWNLGGPMVKPEDAAKKLAWSEMRVSGPTNAAVKLPRPQARDGFYRDLFVVAYRAKTAPVPADLITNATASSSRRAKPIQRWEHKAMFRTLSASAPDTAPLFQDVPGEPGEEDTRADAVTDLTQQLNSDGMLRWHFPEGHWEILRFGCTIGDHSRVSTCSEGWDGYALDVLDAGAFQRYWDAVVEPLIADAGPLAGKTLRYLHTDSWEVEAVNWTLSLREEFRQRRGYDLLPWLPTLAGRIVNTREESNRFYHDFRRTLGDLAVANHYVPFVANARRHGLLIHPESGGPHSSPIDAQRCLEMNDAPMSEFWAWSWRHRVGDANRFFVKQPASAAHTTGRKLVLAEGFTTIGPHWRETLWDNLKPSFDKACCEGLNLLVWHAFVCSPEEEGLPGIQYFAGTHFNPNTTWWSKSKPFLHYINRCQFMLQQGLFVADVAFFYGDHVPNFAQLKQSDPARILPGYDYDVVSGETLLTRMSVKDQRLVLPDGMSYRALVLRDLGVISLPILKKLKEFAAAGALIIGERPNNPGTLENYPQCDAEFTALANELWGRPDIGNQTGRPRILSRVTPRQALLNVGLRPDFEWSNASVESGPSPDMDYIHRRQGQTDIYFIANRSTNAIALDCTFRVAGKLPELWDPLSGSRRAAGAYSTEGGRTVVPLDFDPCGSCFVVFRAPTAEPHGPDTSNRPELLPLASIDGPWTVRFDAKSGGPGSEQFDRLMSWTEHANPGVKFYSGTATYQKSFMWYQGQTSQPPTWRTVLDLGDLRELAEVRLNGTSCGITWSPPFQVDISDSIKPGENRLEIELVNFWPNRIIGDDHLPEAQRMTRTNIRKLTKTTPLMRSGLFGPVTILAKQAMK
jgi:hypothetical protein